MTLLSFLVCKSRSIFHLIELAIYLDNIVTYVDICLVWPRMSKHLDLTLMDVKAYVRHADLTLSSSSLSRRTVREHTIFVPCQPWSLLELCVYSCWTVIRAKIRTGLNYVFNLQKWLYGLYDFSVSVKSFILCIVSFNLFPNKVDISFQNQDREIFVPFIVPMIWRTGPSPQLLLTPMGRTRSGWTGAYVEQNECPRIRWSASVEQGSSGSVSPLVTM